MDTSRSLTEAEFDQFDKTLYELQDAISDGYFVPLSFDEAMRDIDEITDILQKHIDRFNIIKAELLISSTR